MNQPSCLIRRFSSLEYQQSTKCSDYSQQRSNSVGLSSSLSDCRQEGGLSSVTKDEVSKPLKVNFLRQNFFQISNLGYGVGRVNVISSWEPRLIWKSVRHASTATAGKQENDRNEQQAAKQVKEASPEECDQAVEGLSTVKAKAKAKQMQDSQKSTKSIMQRVWAMLLGIGPALRAVASMSRFKFCCSSRYYIVFYAFVSPLIPVYILCHLLGKTGLKNSAIGRMNSNLLCNTIGWVQNYFGLILE